MWTKLWATLLLAVLVQSQKPTTFPNMRDLVSKGYKTHVEMTITDSTKSTRSFFVSEFHDLINKRGKFEMLDKSFYYQNSTNQAAVLKDKKCEVHSMDKLGDLEDVSLWGWLDLKNIIVGPSAVLFRKTKDAPTLNNSGPVFIRGIMCNKFIATTETDEVSLEYYFSVPAWNSSESSAQPTPVRVVCKLTPSRSGSESNLPVDIMLDFTMFKTNIKSDFEYQIPPGIGCQGLNAPDDKVIPPIADQYSLVFELYDLIAQNEHSESFVKLLRIWFDSQNHIVKMTRSIGDKQVRTQEIQQIFDFNTGVVYQMFDDETCITNPIPEHSTTEKQSTNSLGEMSTASDFMGLTADYYYLGKDIYRGIESDIWEAVRFNITSDGQFLLRSIYTYYFISSDVESVSEGDASFNVPIALHITGFTNRSSIEPEVKMVYNIFGFDKYEGIFETNIESCFEDRAQKKYFMVHFPSDANKSALAKANDAFIRVGSYLSITAAASVSPIRIPFSSIKIYYEPTQIAIQGLMLNRPPVLSGFLLKEADKFVPTLKMTRFEFVSSAEVCAEFCLSYEESTCKVMASCENDCFVGGMDMTEDMGVRRDDGPFSCSLYSRSVVNSKFLETDLDLTMKTFSKHVTDGKMVLELLDSKNETVTFTANKVDLDIEPSHWNNEKVLYESVYNKYELVDPKVSFTSYEVTKDLTISSAESCYHKCVDDQRLSCASFSYCTVNNRCRLSSVYLDSGNSDGTKEITPGSSCNVYRKSASQFFEKMVGQVPEMNGKVSYPNVISEDQCAVWCKKEYQFDCKGFEYCESTKKCILHDIHVLDMRGETSKTPTCSHFSRKYSAEFTSLGPQIINDPASKEIKAIGFDECAKICYEKQSLFNCRSINYCEPLEGKVSRCQLNTISVENKTGTLIPSNECQHYTVNGGWAPESKPKFPFAKDIFSKGYNVEAEVTKFENGISRSVFYDEFHDVLEKRGRVNRVEDGSSYFYFKDIGQVLLFENNACKALTFANASFINRRTEWELLDSENLIFGPSSVLWRETKAKPEFIETTEIRGIPVEKWVAQDMKDAVTIEYYVSSNIWKTVNTIRLGTPVAVIAKGTFGKGQAVNLRIDFTFVKDSVPTFSQFMIPKGIGCKGFKTDPKRIMPKLKNQISFITEKYNMTDGKEHADSHVEVNRIYFDGDAKLVRFDLIDEKHKPFKTIEDIGNGVMYYFDENEVCTIKPMEFSWAEDGSKGDDGTKFDANHFMAFFGDFYYLGRELSRGLNCDVWESVKENIKLFGVPVRRLVQTVHFMAPDFISAPGGSTQVKQGIVTLTMSMQLREKDDPVEMLFNVFEFNDATDRMFYNAMSVDSCFREDQKEYFMVHFSSKPEWMETIKENIQSFKLEALVTIALTAQVSIIRVSKIEVFLGPAEVLVLGIILDKPNRVDHESSEPSLKEALITLKQSISDRQIYLAWEDSNNKYPKIALLATKFEDRLAPDNWSENSKYDTVKTKSQLDVRSETTMEIVLPITSIGECFQLCLKEESISCASFSYCKKNSGCRISSVYLDSSRARLEDELVDATDCVVYNKNSLRFFEPYPGQTSEMSGDRALKNMKTASECALNCRQEKGFHCKGFEFCENSLSCVLHKSHFLDSPRKSGSPLCTHYSQKFSLEFSDMGRFVLLSKETPKAEKGVSFEECAKLCYESSEFKCKSINYCKFANDNGQYTCEMNSKSTSDKDAELGSSPSCSHFTRNEEPIEKPIEAIISITSGKFAGTAIGVMIFGIFLGVVAFLGYKYFRPSHQTADGTSVRYIKT